MFDTEKFIAEVELRPAIYDFKSREYGNRECKLRAWDEIGREMYSGWDDKSFHEKNTLVKELQIKWKSIRDHFMRQLKQNVNGDAPKKKKYVYFDQLLFLTRNLDARRYLPSYTSIKQEEDLSPVSGEVNLKSPRKNQWKPPRFEFNEIQERQALADTLNLGVMGYPRDELQGDRMGNRMFLLSLLPIMERLPDHVNLRARLQLMEVLQAALASNEVSDSFSIGYHDNSYYSQETASQDGSQETSDQECNNSS
ncbi:uncharacterized protein LOC106664354 [Cimex lectularius]|uniref:BESS domain-containing protein n=1 Tax=Cimex lectularius TaxID=79782 RepID=A0A8I6RNR8_CIMLE|nr:uncharacterized protein LOC106664354 [Cimex lectularius]